MLQWEFEGKHLHDDSIKVLGLYWLASSDCFRFHAAVPPEGLCLIKRVVLSWFSRIFDPLGLAAPYIMQAKYLFQELWKLGLQWDDEIPHEYQTQFMRWVDGLEALGQWKIPRNYTGTRWCDIKCLQLHGFGDASPKGYGACVYLIAESSLNNERPSWTLSSIPHQSMSALGWRKFASTCLINSHSLGNKAAIIEDHIAIKKFNMVAVTQTWLG